MSDTIQSIAEEGKIVVEVGMPATLQYGGDQYPQTVVEILRGGQTIVTVWADPIDYGDPNTLYKARENGSRHEYTRRRNGSYLPKGQTTGVLHLGFHKSATDYSR